MCGEQDSNHPKNILYKHLCILISLALLEARGVSPSCWLALINKKSEVSPSKLQQAREGELSFNLACLYKQASKPKA